MNLRCRVMLGMVALVAMGFLGQSAQGASATIQFSPNGTGSVGAISIIQWNLLNSDVVGVNSNASVNTLSSVGSSGAPFLTLLQGQGQTFQNPVTSATGFTAVGAFRETPTLLASSFPTASVGFTITSGGTAILNNLNGTAAIVGSGAGAFQWNSTAGPSLANGTGFTPGTGNVATGTWFNVFGASSGFTATGLGTLGGDNANEPSGTNSVVGTGSVDYAIFIPNPNPAFFPNIPAGDGLLLNVITTVTTPFGGATDTSSTFFSGGSGSFLPDNTNFNGSGNGEGSSGDFLFQATNPAITFYLVTAVSTAGVPEIDPNSIAGALALLSGGLLYLTERRRRSKK
jgi:hypothetical protein